MTGPLAAQTRPLGGLGGLGSGGGSGSSPFGADTSKIDTSKPVQPNIVRVSPHGLLTHLPLGSMARDSVRTDIAIVPEWDILFQGDASTNNGFTQTLGQLGKPYQTWQYGLDSRLLPGSALWQNPLYGRYSHYIMRAEDQIPYFDTKTPYVNIGYSQGSKKLQAVSVTASGNINPRWNVAVGHERRKSVGPYALSEDALATDHRNLYGSTYYRSKSNRYHAFGNAVYNELRDDLFGGEYRTATQTDLASFQKAGAQLVLDRSLAHVIARSLYTDHYYHLLGKPDDSVKVRSRLTLRASAKAEVTTQSYSAPFILHAKLNTHIVPIMPTVDPGSASVAQYAKTQSNSVLGGAGYTLDAEVFVLRLWGDVGYSSLRFAQDSAAFSAVTRTLHTVSQTAHGILAIPRLHTQITADANQAKPDLLPFRNDLSLGLKTQLVPGRISLLASAFVNNANPTLYQRYAVVQHANTFVANPALTNQQLTHARAAVRWDGRAAADTMDRNYIQAGAFASRADKLIYYTDSLRIRQAGGNENLTWVGLSAQGRVHFWKKYYLQGQASWQQGATNAPSNADLMRYTSQIPRVYGKVSLYYDNRDLKIAGILRTGIDVYLNAAYQAQALDVISGEFFPTDYKVSGYLRSDIWFATLVHRTYIFLKITNVGEGIGVRGYYTTPGYPMLERTFSFGANWSFYD